MGSSDAQAQAEQYGNIRLNIPQGWASKPNGTAVILTPTNLTGGKAALIAISPSQKLSDLDAQFDRFVKSLQSGRSIVKLGDLISGPSPDGYGVRRREMILRTSDGGMLHLFITAANPNNRFESLSYAANSAEVYKQYFPQIERMINTIKFVESKAGSPSQPRVAATTRADGEKEPGAPPPNGVRLNGLYVTQDSEGGIGPGGTISSNLAWRFYYFLPNGYVYLGPKEAGLENIQCTGQTVNKYGSTLCTTYSIDNGKIHIGERNPTRFARRGSGVLIGDYSFDLVPKLNNVRIDGAYSTFSAGSSAASSSEIRFSRDGRFTSSSFIGVSVDTGPDSGGDRISVAGNGSGRSEGTYRLNGYTLELTYRDGRKAKAFFAQVAGDQVVRIGTRSYTQGR
jgi:hypothetical protein